MKDAFTSRPALAVYAILLLLTADRGSAKLAANSASQSGEARSVSAAIKKSQVAVKRKGRTHDSLGAAFRGNGSDSESNSRVFVTTPGTSDDLSFLYQAEFADNSSADDQFQGFSTEIPQAGSTVSESRTSASASSFATSGMVGAGGITPPQL
jgi:hypothetical protein